MSAALGARRGLGAVPDLPALTLCAVGLGLVFAPEIGAAVHVWNASTAYGHCWLVMPIALFLAYERRFEAAAIAPAPLWWPCLVAVPLLGFWMAANVLGVMEGRQLAVIGFAELAFLAALGLRRFWVLSPALLYLVFLVPFGAFLTGPLQDFTAGFVARGLDFLGVPNRVTQYQIEIPEGSFYVAEACAGLRFLIASIAFGTLYAVTMFRSWGRRAAFVAVSCIVPVVANGFRGLGIVLLGHVLGSAQAAATDHVLYGFIFFGIVIALLAAAGMPFRQDATPAQPHPAFVPAGTRRAAVLAVLPVLAVAGAGPVLSAGLDARAGRAGDAHAVLVAGPGCTMTAARPSGPVLTQDFRCGQTRLTARTEMLPQRSNPARVTRAGASWAASRVTGANTDNRVLAVGGAAPQEWHMLVNEDGRQAAASLVFVDGAPVGGGIKGRLRVAADMLRRGGSAPVAVSVAIDDGRADPVEVLRSFLEGQGDLQGRVAGAALMPPG